MKPVYLNALGVASALGSGWRESARRLFAGEAPGMRHSDTYSPGRRLPCGEVVDVLPTLDGVPLEHQSRNNRLLQHAVDQIQADIDTVRESYRPTRIGVVLGTSTSGIAECERALAERGSRGTLPEWFHYRQQELGSPAAYLAERLDVSGPVYVISTACSSSGHALASAARLIDCRLADCIIAGGVDTLCRFTLSGFDSLASVSETVCNPMSVNRDGITLGEAAAVFLVSRDAGPVCLTGWGGSSDAYHMSAPHPEGAGARLAAQEALNRAGMRSSGVDYINLHGTGTAQNDLVESRVVTELFGSSVPMSSTKAMSGHTLGAAGSLEAAVAWITLHPDNVRGQLPPHVWDGAADPALPPMHLVSQGESLGRPVRSCVSNSFGFGGNNAVLVLEAG